MKKLIVIMVLVFSFFIVAVAADNTVVACKNQDGDFECSPGDSSCTYTVFSPGPDPEASDGDGDGWTDSCDAFPDDDSENSV